MTRQEAEEILAQLDEDERKALFADSFDEAIIGVTSVNGVTVVAYSIEKCIEILSRDMSYEEATEFFDFNVAGSHLGEGTPLWIQTEV